MYAVNTNTWGRPAMTSLAALLAALGISLVGFSSGQIERVNVVIVDQPFLVEARDHPGLTLASGTVCDVSQEMWSPLCTSLNAPLWKPTIIATKGWALPYILAHEMEHVVGGWSEEQAIKVGCKTQVVGECWKHGWETRR